MYFYIGMDALTFDWVSSVDFVSSVYVISDVLHGTEVATETFEYNSVEGNLLYMI